MKERKCCDCEEIFERRKSVKKINGDWLCRACYISRRKNRRKETIKEARKLEKPIIRKPKQEPTKAKDFPKIKGSKKTKKDKNYSYITIQEKQNLLRMLMSRGMDFDDAKERIKDLVEEQKRVKECMKERGKTEKQIKVKQMEMIEELWDL